MLTWSFICSARKIDRAQKTPEAFYITLMRPILNEKYIVLICLEIVSSTSIIQELL